ncbi:transcriptional regulator [Rubidibacter lacunae KORDI 51-2]|uniref:Transcriptional regulator n=1 Tax=Rubidibacter lacunae KORDI 51-2 TaxID=582515 RepID=U5DJ66_9CHRO|nr:LysR family transcriptional regulator [Rubidibacter lacunae]ERN40604.1 transcriptional regulator [Rubidibacter lacunae KORDI 51-2]
MKNATLHQLKVFAVAARHLSFTRAAEELFLTQPTVSMQMKQLTKAVGLPLFEQIGKRLYLTDAGKHLATTCQRIFSELSEFESVVADLKGLKQGQLEIAAVSTTKYFLPRIIGPFCQRYPGVDIALQFTNHEHILNALLENQYDIYILSLPPDSPEVVTLQIMENPLVAIAPREHALAGQVKVPLERLAQEPFIMREVGSGTRRAIEELFSERGLEISVRLELGSNEAIKQAIVGGLGVSVLSKHTLALEKEDGPLVVLDVESLPIQRHWYAIYPAGKQPTIVAKTFLEFLESDTLEPLSKAIPLIDEA